MRVFHIAALTGLTSFLAVAAMAAPPPPSVDDIIGSLTPNAVKQACPPGTPCRGIRAAGGGTVQAPAAAGAPAQHATAAAPASGSGSGSLDLTVEFPSGSAALTPSVKASLSHLGQALASPKLAAYKFRIEGHTDTVGDAAVNQSLSEKRANSVVAFLTSSFGIDASRLQAVGLGEKDLAVATPPQTAEARNRRVHIVNLGS
jgi:outer membrane protein OmpA-like peptidoglycan-associated protein